MIVKQIAVRSQHRRENSPSSVLRWSTFSTRAVSWALCGLVWGCAPSASTTPTVPAINRSPEPANEHKPTSLLPVAKEPESVDAPESPHATGTREVSGTDGTTAIQEDTSPSVSPGWIGIAMKQTDSGVLVADVSRGSPAAAAGLLVGDRLVRVDANPVAAPSDVGSYVQSVHPGARITLDVRRNGETRLLTATVEPKPDREALLRRALVGEPAPSLSELRTVQGSVVPSWTQLHGHVVVLEFWASWCVACRALGPTLNDWHDEMKALGVHILGITADPFEEAVRGSETLAYPTFCDENGDVTLRYHGMALPTLVIVDKSGVVVDAMVGLNFERLEALRRQVLALASDLPSP